MPRIVMGLAGDSLAPGLVLSLLLLAGFIGLLLWFASANHHSADRGAGRICLQLALMAAFTAAGVMMVAGAEWLM
jgi:hypothetical protein